MCRQLEEYYYSTRSIALSYQYIHVVQREHNFQIIRFCFRCSSTSSSSKFNYKSRFIGKACVLINFMGTWTCYATYINVPANVIHQSKIDWIYYGKRHVSDLRVQYAYRTLCILSRESLDWTEQILYITA